MLEEKPSVAPLPERSQCLYVEPLPNGDRKNCKNCALWVTSSRCLIHDPVIWVDKEAICGYWVGGKPQEGDLHLNMKLGDFVSPAFSGLTIVKEGTSCDNCKWYEPKDAGSGRCHGLEEKGQPPPVQARGCCARWEQ